uniref:Metalloendopeptidase n=1 Tax=Bursaphelenchus xylophilus TaxID=6326 RepID=A0A1I7SG82_BURXY
MVRVLPLNQVHLCHTLGFFHEQGRYDRDGHINIAPKNIHVGFLSQFTKQDPESMTTLSVPYDVGSVMHYDQYSFSYNGHPSIRAIDPNYQMTMGQRQELTFNDVKKINLAYCPFRCLLKLDCQYSGYTDPKDCSKCRCPSGLSGQTCSKALRTASKCGRLYHTATSEIKTLSFEGKGECNFLIKAKDGAKIRLHWEKLFIFESQPCQNSYVEIKYHKDLGTTGARFCSTDIKQKDINSAISTVLVLYRSKSLFTSFKLTFSSDEPAPSRSIFSQSMAYFSNFFHSIFHSEKGKDSDDSDNFINSSNEEYDEEEAVKIDDDKKKVSGVVQQKVPDEKKKLNEAIDEIVLPKSGEKLVLIKEKVDEKDNEQKEKAIEGKPDESWVAEAESSVEDDKEFNNGTVDDIIILNDDKKGKLEETTSTSSKTYTIRDDVSNTTVLDVQTEAILTTDLKERLTKAQTAATTNDKDTSTALPDAFTANTTQFPSTSEITKLAEAENETTTEVVEENLNVTETAPITPSGKINPSTESDDNFALTEKVPVSTPTTSESIPEQEEEETEPSQTSNVSNDSVTTTTVDYTSIGIEIRRAQAKNSNEIIEMGSGDDTDLIEYTVQREEEVIKSSAKSSADEILEALKAEPDLIVIPNPQLRECKNNALTTTPRPISTTIANSVARSTVLISHSVDEITRIPVQDTDELIEGSGTR